VGYKLPALDVEAAPIDSLIDPKLLRDDIAGLPKSARSMSSAILRGSRLGTTRS